MLKMLTRLTLGDWLTLTLGFFTTLAHTVLTISVASVIFAHLTQASWRDAALDTLSYSFLASMAFAAISALAMLKTWLLGWRLSRWNALVN